MSMRDTQAAIMITEKAAEYIAREAGRNTLITPTRTDLSKDGKNATIYVSVYPEGQDEHVIKFLMRHKDLFRNTLKKTMRLVKLPYITFAIDYGERNRQNLDLISKDVHIPDIDPDDLVG